MYTKLEDFGNKLERLLLKTSPNGSFVFLSIKHKNILIRNLGSSVKFVFKATKKQKN